MISILDNANVICHKLVIKRKPFKKNLIFFAAPAALYGVDYTYSSRTDWVRECFRKKSCCSFGLCPNEGAGRALPKFFVTFSSVHFWSIKGVYFLQNANNLNFKLFLRLYTWPKKQVFCLYLKTILDNESFWMSLKSTFLALKKSGTSCPNYLPPIILQLVQFF